MPQSLEAVAKCVGAMPWRPSHDVVGVGVAVLLAATVVAALAEMFETVAVAGSAALCGV